MRVSGVSRPLQSASCHVLARTVPEPRIGWAMQWMDGHTTGLQASKHQAATDQRRAPRSAFHTARVTWRSAEKAEKERVEIQAQVENTWVLPWVNSADPEPGVVHVLRERDRELAARIDRPQQRPGRGVPGRLPRDQLVQHGGHGVQPRHLKRPGAPRDHDDPGVGLGDGGDLQSGRAGRRVSGRVGECVGA